MTITLLGGNEISCIEMLGLFHFCDFGTASMISHLYDILIEA